MSKNKDAAAWAEIETVLRERVRPALAEHEGDVAPVSYEDGVLKVRLLGRCSGCPSAALTTETLIAEQVKAALPWVRDVVLLGGVSDDTLALARQILKQRHEDRA